MDIFSKLFEKTNEQDVTPDDILIHKIEDEIRGLLVALKGDYWFHDDTKFSDNDVLIWIKENRPEFYKKAIIEPDTVEGSDTITDALSALGLMKGWHDVDEDELQSPEDIEHWKIATGCYDEE